MIHDKLSLLENIKQNVCAKRIMSTLNADNNGENNYDNNQVTTSWTLNC